MRYAEHASPITTPTTTSSAIHGGATIVMGWSLRETTGAASAVAEIYDGNDTTGQLITTISMTSNESTRDWLGPNGVECSRGIYVAVVSGSIKGTVWARLRHHPQGLE